MLTGVDGIGSRGQDLTIAATRLLTRRCTFGGDDQRAFLNCMARLLKLAKSVHILSFCFLPPGMNGKPRRPWC